MRRTPALALALFLGLESTAQAQGTYRDYLARQLSAIAQTVVASGYRPHVMGSRPIDSDLESTVTFQAGNATANTVGLEIVLEPGVRYAIETEPYNLNADDCGKTLEDNGGNRLATGVWDEDRSQYVLDFTATISGPYIFVAHCPKDAEGFFYWYDSMLPAESSLKTHPRAYPADMIVGFLRSGATVGLDVVLERGVDYLIAGVCDQDCTDLDLSLMREDGEILFMDELDDDAPVLQFTAPADGLHALVIRMYACSVEPCSFAYQVFRR